MAALQKASAVGGVGAGAALLDGADGAAEGAVGETLGNAEAGELGASVAAADGMALRDAAGEALSVGLGAVEGIVAPGLVVTTGVGLALAEPPQAATAVASRNATPTIGRAVTAEW
ncbi:MAG: hypothetical protein H0V87_11510 [Chloroflexi bacterium]|nr:hypothetical protein [Chloroflexota bacterium]